MFMVGFVIIGLMRPKKGEAVDKLRTASEGDQHSEEPKRKTSMQRLEYPEEGAGPPDLQKFYTSGSKDAGEDSLDYAERRTPQRRKVG
jgi:hypothetical protein